MENKNKQEQIAQYLADITKKKSTSQTIPRRTSQTFSPLSFGQERLWFLYQLDKNSPAYNRPTILRFRGYLNRQVLNDCINRILERHEVLRTSFPLVDGEPMAKLTTSSEMQVPVVDLTAYPASKRIELAYQKMGKIIDMPFNLETGPIVKFQFYKVDHDVHIFLFVCHHIAFDAWSETILINEIAAWYGSLLDDAAAPVPTPAIQYTDYAHWQRDQALDWKYRHALAYWKEKLSGITALNLPLDFPRPPIQTFSGRSIPFELPRSLKQGLKEISLREAATLFMTLFSAYLVLLHRYTNAPDIVVGTPIAGREQKETEKTIGLFIRTLTLRIGMEGNPTFRELLSRIRKMVLEAFTYSDVPFERIVEELRPGRSLAQTPIFQVFFNLENIPEPVSQMDGIKVDRLMPEIKYVQYDLGMELHETVDLIQGSLEFNTNLFKEATIHRMVAHFLILLDEICKNPDQKIGYLNLMDEAEFDQVVSKWNDTKTQFTDTVFLHQLFENQVQETPAATALIFKGEKVSYAKLNWKANQLARYLRTQGVVTGYRVGIHVQRSIEMITSIIGVIKSGATYVPLDPSLPEDRLQTMANDAQARFILDGCSEDDHFEHLDCRIIPLDEIQAELSSFDSTNLESKSDPMDIVYIFYTSGSTGEPKGVLIRNQSVVNYLTYFTQYCGLKSSDIVLQIPPISFDASVEDIFGTLISGGRLILLPEESVADMSKVLQLIEQEKVTCILSTVPSFWRAFISFAANHKLNNPSLRLITISGEVLYSSDCEKLWEIFGSDLTLINTYGPTECTIVSTFYKIPQGLGKDSPVSLGRPIQNYQVYILDEYLSPVPVGIVGEIFIGGAGLANGYLNQPRLTAESFIPHPFAKCPGDRLYRSGDRARWFPDGTIEFIGRNDRQVKIRGNRVELGEVETVIRTHPGIEDIAVVSHQGLGTETALIAYITPDGHGILPDVTELRNFLRDKLPDYMTPSTFIPLESLPLTTNGKINYQELPHPDLSRPDLGTPYLAPKTALEKKLSEIWAKHLQVERVGIKDDFFDLGGHSLMAIRIMADIESTFGKEVPLATLFQATTIESLSNLIQNGETGPEFKSLVPVQPRGSKPPLFCVPPAAATAMRFEKLSKHLGDDQPLYGFDYPGMDGKSEPVYNIPELAKVFIRDLIQVQPAGPYFLCGMCYGGNVAFEMASQLMAQGNQVAFLGIIDSNFAPGKRKPFQYYSYRTRLFVKKVILKQDVNTGECIKWNPRWEPLKADPLNNHIVRVFEANIIARLAYTSSAYPGKITKFSTNWHIAEMATKKWQKSTTVALEDHPIPGSHVLRSPEDTGIMSEANIQAFTQIFRQCLERAQNTKS